MSSETIGNEGQPQPDPVREGVAPAAYKTLLANESRNRKKIRQPPDRAKQDATPSVRRWSDGWCHEPSESARHQCAPG